MVVATSSSMRARARSCMRSKQRGMVMLVVLMVLIMMFLAGIGAMRSVDTGNLIAGNFAFQQAAVQAGDRAITDARNMMSAAVVGGGGNNPIVDRYLNTQQVALDARGFPSAIDWSAVACTDENGAVVADCNADLGNYRVQYVIERMCTSNPTLTDVNDIRALCEYEANPLAATPAAVSVRYRVLIRVRGPRGTEGWYEAMLTGPVSA